MSAFTWHKRSVWYPLRRGDGNVTMSGCGALDWPLEGAFPLSHVWTLFSLVLCLFSLFWSLAPIGNLAHYPFILIPCSLCLLLLQYCLVMLCFSLPCVLNHSMLHFVLCLIIFTLNKLHLDLTWFSRDFPWHILSRYHGHWELEKC